MSKLLKLKEWLTVEDAAKRLSISVGEEVTETDILRLALDGHLTLSVYFVNHARGRMGRIVSYEETEWALFPALGDSPKIDPTSNYKTETKTTPPALIKLCLENPEALTSGCRPVMTSLNIDDQRFINLENEVVTLRGVWDLPMWGAEVLDVEHRYQSLTGGPEVTLIQLFSGTFVQKNNGIICQLQESFDNNEYQLGSRAHLEKLKLHITKKGIEEEEAKKLLDINKEQRQKLLEEMGSMDDINNYYPAGELPADSVFVVRTSALRELEQSLNADEPKPEKPLDSRERNTFERLIYVLANTEIKFGPNDAKALQHAAELQGIHITGKGTIAKHLNAAFTRGERERRDKDE